MLNGSSRRDVIVGSAGADRIKGGGGNDLICAGPGADVVSGGGGNDRILGGAGADVLHGNAGDDHIEGGKEAKTAASVAGGTNKLSRCEKGKSPGRKQVANGNRAPLAKDLSATTDEDSPKSIAVAEWQAWTKEDGDSLSFSSFDTSGHDRQRPRSSTAAARSGSTPPATSSRSPPGQSAQDSFRYSVADGPFLFFFFFFTVTVTCVDDPPVAVNDTATVAEDAAASAIDVLANDTDPDGGPKSIASVTQPANGTVAITGGGTGLTYRPNPNYCNAQPARPTLHLHADRRLDRRP